jgi:hypothetical protein
MLARYAEYANIGGNKTGGYGETRLVLKKGQDKRKEMTYK